MGYDHIRARQAHGLDQVRAVGDFKWDGGVRHRKLIAPGEL
jgi:hypothetical protein